MTTYKMKIGGMHCRSCQRLIEEVCSGAAGVSDCVVDLSAGTAVIAADGGFDAVALVSEIKKVGDYQVEIL